MKEAIKRILLRVPAGARFLHAYQSYQAKRALTRFASTEDVFTHFYRVNIWNDTESISGPGSTAEYTANIRKEIPLLMDRLEVRTILDASCGDYNWFRLIPRNDHLHYVGGDIVEPLVAKNQTLYGNATTRFLKLDITRDRLPDADLWICRDCLFHFSNEMIFQTLGNFLQGDNIRYLLTSLHPLCLSNTDIPTGSFRELNLRLPPFNFPEPLLLIDDWIEGFPVRQLGLWERTALVKAAADYPR